MDILVIESFSWSPHLETAGEIAITQAISGKKVGFSFINEDNPDDIRVIPGNLLTKLIGVGWQRKVRQLEKYLRKYGVEILHEESLSSQVYLQIKDFFNNTPQSLDDLKNYTYKDAELGLATVSSLISQTKSLHPDPDANRLLIQRYLRFASTTYEKARALMLRYQPKTIISFNGRFACAKAIFEAAKSLGIEVQYHERGATYDRYQLYQEQPHDTSYIRQLIQDYWQRSDLDKEEIGHSFYKRKKQGDGIGWISFVSTQQKNLVPEKIKERHQIVYFSSSDDEFAAVGDLVRQPIFKDQRDAMRFLIDWVATQNDCDLTIRVHPHLQHKSSEDCEWWNSLQGKNLQVIPSNSNIDSYALMNWADVVISYGSTAGIEAAYWGKPSILLGDSGYSGLGCVYEPANKAEVYALLADRNLAPLPQEKCLPYGYFSLVMGIKYRYYSPANLSGGIFLGKSLNYMPEWYGVVRKLYRGIE